MARDEDEKKVDDDEADERDEAADERQDADDPAGNGDGDDKGEEDEDAPGEDEDAPDEDEDAPGEDEDAPDEDEDAPEEPEAGVRARRPPLPAPAAAGTSTRNIAIFVLLVGGLAVAFAVVGQLTASSGGGRTGGSRFESGKTYPVSLTLTVDDVRELACAAAGDTEGLHCAFEGQSGKPHPKGQKALEDEGLLQPYTTVDQNGQLLGGGLWAQAALKEKLDKEKGAVQSPRFSVDCQYTVSGYAKDTTIRWHARDPWIDATDWPIGKLTDCKVGK